MDGQLLLDELSELESEAVYAAPEARELRTTNTIERLHEEFRRRVKTQARCPPKTQHWSCSSASWPAGRSTCARSTAGGESPRCTTSAYLGQTLIAGDRNL